MATQLIFTEEFAYDDDPFGITIPVMLSYGATDILVSAKVDTGAQVCLFSHEDGLKLGIPIEQGLFTKLESLSGPPRLLRQISRAIAKYTWTSGLAAQLTDGSH